MQLNIHKTPNPHWDDKENLEHDSYSVTVGFSPIPEAIVGAFGLILLSILLILI